jgi:hypothetical protein
MTNSQPTRPNVTIVTLDRNGRCGSAGGSDRASTFTEVAALLLSRDCGRLDQRNETAAPGRRLLHKPPTDPVRRTVMGRPMLRAAEYGRQLGRERRRSDESRCVSHQLGSKAFRTPLCNSLDEMQASAGERLAVMSRPPRGNAEAAPRSRSRLRSAKLRRQRPLAVCMGYCPHRRKTRVTGRPVICARCRRNARRKSRVARSSVMSHALASPPPPPSRQRHGRRPARPQGAPLVDVSQGRHPLGRLRTHSTDHDSTRRGPSFLAFTRRRHPVATA